MLFILKKFFLGSEYDYNFFKNHCSYYLSFLKKNPKDMNDLPSDQSLGFLGELFLIGGYYTDNDMILEFRKLISFKDPKTIMKKLRNKEIDKGRVHIERFFW